MQLLRVPAFVAMIVAGICITFSSVSFVTWGIDYAKTYKDFSTKEASLSLAVIALFSSVLGALSAGYFADRLQKKFAYGRVLVIALAFLAAAPFLLVAIQADEKWTVLAGFLGSMFFMSWYHGPTTAVLHDLTPQRAHATAIGVYMFSTQLLGALGPLLIGKISDMTRSANRLASRDRRHGLRRAFVAPGDLFHPPRWSYTIRAWRNSAPKTKQSPSKTQPSVS